MRILHTIPNLGLHSGGPSTCTYHLLKGLNGAGVQADVLTFSSGEDDVIGDDAFIKRVCFDAVSPLLYSRNMKRYLRQQTSYDLYHANSIWTLPSHETRLAAKKQDKPFVLAPHGMLYPQALQVSSWKKKLALPLFQRKDLEAADCLQATCEDELMHIRNFGLKNPVAIIPNCLYIPALPAIRQQENPVRRIGFIGRLHRIKNVDVLIRAWLKLGEKTKEAELFIIGDGEADYKLELRELAEKSSIKNIHFSGFLSGETLQAAVASLDFQVLPSKSENFGMVVPEALVHGVPVIAGKGTPWKELEINHCGWWVDSTIDSLSQVLSQALELNECSRRRMGERGRQLVIDNYLMDKVSLKMKQLYEWMLTGKEVDFVNL